MNIRRGFVMTAFAVVGIAACAKVQVSDREVLVDDKEPRPRQIWVYDFAATPQDVPANSALAGQATAAPPQTPEQIALGREVGAEVAKALVAQIDAMGLPAVHVAGEPSLEVNDLAIHGTLLSVVEGSQAERVVIGLGEGAAQLRVAVEGFQMTPSGLREVGSGKLDTKASKSPGAAVPLAVAIATKNPLGLIVSTGVKLHGEKTGSSTIHGKARDVAKEIADQLRPRFEAQGWIPPSGKTG